MAISEGNQVDMLRYSLRHKGLDAVLAGRPVEGEGYYRTALAAELPDEERVRFLVCLGDALIDQGLHEEGEGYLAEALALGDATGAAQGSMADVLLLERKNPERALELAEQSFALSSAAGEMDADEGIENLRGARLWTRRAQAQMQMGRQGEARLAVETAVLMAREALMGEADADDAELTEMFTGVAQQRLEELATAATHLGIGAALVALGEEARAAHHFRIAWNSDGKGKYRRLAEKALDGMGAPTARARHLQAARP